MVEIDGEHDECGDTCPATGGSHIPDWNSLCIEMDGEPYLDVNCGRCGRSGCVASVKHLEEDISW